MAAGEGRLQLVKLLLHHGADPAAVDNRGNTGAGEVSGQPLKTLATKIKPSWFCWFYYSSIAEVRCAAALAGTGHLTEVEYM